MNTTSATEEARETRGVDVGRLTPSIDDLARRVYAELRHSGEAARLALRRRVDEAGRLDELIEWACGVHLDMVRRQGNSGKFAQVEALTNRLSVEVPPAGYRNPEGSPRERLSSLESVLTGDDSGRGATTRRPVAAYAVFVKITIKVDSEEIVAGNLTRDELLRYAERLEAMGRGCFNHAAVMRDLWADMRPGETGHQAVRRMRMTASGEVTRR